MLELRPHQRTALEKLHNGSVLTGGVGTGKTITALFYFYEKVMGGVVGSMESIQTPMDLYVFTTARKRDDLDWQGTAAQMGIGRERDASVAGITIVVDSYNNIMKYSQIKGAFIILDEQRMVGSGAWSKTFLRMAKNNQWIMLSATPGDTWLDYIPLFIANGFYKNRTEFKREHVVYNTYSKFPKVDRFIAVNKLVRHRNSILVPMPYERHTVRHIVTVNVEHDKELLERVVKKRWHPYEERPLRDVAELFSVMRRVVNSHSSRLTALHTLIDKHPRLIVFYNFDYELLPLRSIVSTMQDQSVSVIPNSKKSTRSTTGSTQTIKVAEWNGHKHEQVPDSERWVYLVQYAAGAEAWNCVATDAIAFYSMNYSYRMFEQAMGRIDRLDTPFLDLFYYVLVSNSAIDHALLKARKSKKDFNEKSYGLNN